MRNLRYVFEKQDFDGKATKNLEVQGNSDESQNENNFALLIY